MDTIETARIDLHITRGATFREVLRYASPARVYKAITGATRAAPCVLTVVGHGMPDGWPLLVSNVIGMTQLNCECDPNAPQSEDFYIGTVIDADSIELNEVNAAGFRPYQSGGVVTYYQPIDLTGMSGVAQFFDSDADDAEPTLEVALVLDNSGRTIGIVLTAAQTEALEAMSVRINMTDGAGDETRIACGPVKIKECGC